MENKKGKLYFSLKQTQDIARFFFYKKLLHTWENENG
jgi:hypothetical protein